MLRLWDSTLNFTLPLYFCVLVHHKKKDKPMTVKTKNAISVISSFRLACPLPGSHHSLSPKFALSLYSTLFQKCDQNLYDMKNSCFVVIVSWVFPV